MINRTGLTGGLFFILMFTVRVLAAEYVISDEGKQILLHDDGTWVQVSRDRYAVNADGQRIRLKPDGTWTVVSLDKPVEELSVERLPDAKDANKQVQALPNASEIELLLRKAEIQKRKTRTLKSVRLETRTIFYLTIRNLGQTPIDIGDDFSAQLHAYASSGEKFELIELDGVPTQVDPGQQEILIVRFDGSPQWFGIKYLSLEIQEYALGNPVKRVLSIPMDDVIIQQVKEF